MNIIRNIMAVLVVLLIILSTLFASIIIIVFYPINLLLPRFIQNKIYRHFLINTIVIWADFNYYVLLLSTFGCWDLPSKPKREMSKSVLLISNHQSWFDIIVITILTRHRLPSFLFFMKQDLLWSLPFVGVMCWMLGFPLLKRPSRESLRKRPNLRESTRKYTHEICQRIKRNGPRTIIIFPEGTRRRGANLKSAGCASIINELGQDLSEVIDMTIYYSLPKPSFWTLVSGKAKIIVKYDTIKANPEMFGDYYNDNNYKINFQKWLSGLWVKKDKLLSDLAKQQ